MGKDVIIALDFDSREKTLAFLDRFTEEKPFVKVGMELFYAEGPAIVREIRRRTRVVGSFPDGNSALMLVCARLRHVAGTQWGCKKYMNMKHLEAALDDASIAG